MDNAAIKPNTWYRVAFAPSAKESIHHDGVGRITIDLFSHDHDNLNGAINLYAKNSGYTIDKHRVVFGFKEIELDDAVLAEEGTHNAYVDHIFREDNGFPELGAESEPDDVELREAALQGIVAMNELVTKLVNTAGGEAAFSESTGLPSAALAAARGAASIVIKSQDGSREHQLNRTGLDEWTAAKDGTTFKIHNIVVAVGATQGLVEIVR